jgi:hypothetical protein
MHSRREIFGRRGCGTLTSGVLIVQRGQGRYRGRADYATWDSRTKSVKFQIALQKAPELVDVADFLHVDFRSGFCTGSQCMRRVLAISGGG